MTGIGTSRFQYLEQFGTMSLQFIDSPRRKLFSSNVNHDIIPYLKLDMMSMSVNMNFILKITCLNFLTNLVMQITQMSCKCLNRLINSNM